MSDDIWRRRERDDTREFGGPLFPDEADATRVERARTSTGERRLSFGPDDTGPLPHGPIRPRARSRRSIPPDRRLPRRRRRRPRRVVVVHDRDAVWRTTIRRTARRLETTPAPAATSTGSAPTERRTTAEPYERSAGVVGGLRRADPAVHRPTPPSRTDDVGPRSGRARTCPASRPRPIGTSTLRRASRRGPPRRRGTSRPVARQARPARRRDPAARHAHRRGVGAIIAAVFIAALMCRPVACHRRGRGRSWLPVEYFDKVTREGLPAGHRAGIVAVHRRTRCATYWVGDGAAAVMVFAFTAVCLSFISAGPRVRPDAQHGHHHAGRHLDRYPGFVRGAHPALSTSDRRRPARRSAPTRCSCSPSAWWPTTSGPCSSGRPRGAPRCGRGSAPPRPSRASSAARH